MKEIGGERGKKRFDIFALMVFALNIQLQALLSLF